MWVTWLFYSEGHSGQSLQWRDVFGSEVGVFDLSIKHYLKLQIRLNQSHDMKHTKNAYKMKYIKNAYDLKYTKHAYDMKYIKNAYYLKYNKNAYDMNYTKNWATQGSQS